MKIYDIDGFRFQTNWSDENWYDITEEKWTWKQWVGALILTPIILSVSYVLLVAYLIIT